MLDHYRTLELRPNSSLEEIKKAYRKLARVYHPDSSGTPSHEQRFRDIQEAYEVLSDPIKRRNYDRDHGFTDWAQSRVETYRKNQAQSERFSTHVGSPKQSTRQSTAEWGPDRFAQTSTPPKGNPTRKITPPRTATARSRDRKSTGNITSFVKKLQEQLQAGLRAGQKLKRSTHGSKKPGTFEVSIDAMESIFGTTRSVTLEEHNGPRVIRFKIPAGINSGASLKIQCPASKIHRARNIKISVLIHPHPLVEREGLQIIVKIPITLGEALTGTELEVPTTQGAVRMKIPPCWDSQKRLRIKGKGVQDPSGKETGDLLVQIQIVLPEKIDSKAHETAKTLDRLYLTDVRANIPRKLTPP